MRITLTANFFCKLGTNSRKTPNTKTNERAKQNKLFSKLLISAQEETKGNLALNAMANHLNITLKLYVIAKRFISPGAA